MNIIIVSRLELPLDGDLDEFPELLIHSKNINCTDFQPINSSFKKK